MTLNFEKIVRPYQLGDISPSTSTSSSGTSSDTVTLTYGADAAAKVMFGSETLDITYYVVKQMREKPKPAS